MDFPRCGLVPLFFLSLSQIHSFSFTSVCYVLTRILFFFYPFFSLLSLGKRQCWHVGNSRFRYYFSCICCHLHGCIELLSRCFNSNSRSLNTHEWSCFLCLFSQIKTEYVDYMRHMCVCIETFLHETDVSFFSLHREIFISIYLIWGLKFYLLCEKGYSNVEYIEKAGL